MSVLERTFAQKATGTIDEVLVSADSHVIEPAGLWQRELPASFKDRAPDFGGQRKTDHPGAMDKNKRVEEMATDGVSAEVLFPTHGLRVLSLDEPELEEACARVYNDWLIDYCSAAPDRLFGLAVISTYNIDNAIKEMERCRDAGMVGVTIWQVPPTELPFSSDHYERFWAAAQDMELPVNLHILSGHGYSKNRNLLASGQQRNSVNHKLIQVADGLYDIVFSGVLERFPKLKVVMAESEMGWMPFVLEQWDYYSQRHGTDLKMLPSEYFSRQVYTTFFNDGVGTRMLSWWGQDNCMWSNDYPHGNSIWPHSREIVARDLGNLPAAIRAKLVRDTVAKLYNIEIPAPIGTAR